MKKITKVVIILLFIFIAFSKSSVFVRADDVDDAGIFQYESEEVDESYEDEYDHAVYFKTEEGELIHYVGDRGKGIKQMKNWYNDGNSVCPPLALRRGYVCVGWKSELTGKTYKDDNQEVYPDNYEEMECFVSDISIIFPDSNDPEVWEETPVPGDTYTAIWKKVNIIAFTTEEGYLYRLYNIVDKTDIKEITEKSYAVVEGERIAIIETDRPGYACVGWKNKKTGTVYSEEELRNVIPESNEVYIAIWKRANKITFKSEVGYIYGKSNTKETDFNIAEGAEIGSGPAMKRPGYICVGWKSEKSGKEYKDLYDGIGESICSYIPDGDESFTAIWKAASLITFKSEEGYIYGDENKTSVDYQIESGNEIKSSPKMTRPGFICEGWKSEKTGKVYKNYDDGKGDSILRYIPTGDESFVAIWSSMYTLTFKSSEGYINGDPECTSVEKEIEKGESIYSIPYMSRPGYSCNKWKSEKTGKEYKNYYDGTDDENSIYNYIPSSDESFIAIWKREYDAFLVFNDVDYFSYYYDAVYWAYENEITKGTSATMFSPNDSCTRAQFVTFLWRANGSPKRKTYRKFSDVEKGKYYYDAVMWAAENGITTGYSGTDRFGATDECTREQCVTFLWRAAGKPDVNGSKSEGFSDVKDASKYYFTPVKWAVSKGITTGYSGTDRFGVGDKCSRAQLVTFLYRFYEE